MDFQEIWNKICFLLSDNVRENIAERDFEQQVLRAMEVLGWSEFEGEIRRQVSIPVGRQNTLRLDLVIYDEQGRALIVIEVKRPQEDVSRDDSISQLKSYMRQMRADFGLLVGKEIRIFYDGDRNPHQTDPLLIDKIPFHREEKAGSSFVEMFLKGNFLSRAYLPFLEENIRNFNIRIKHQRLKNALLSNDTKVKIMGFLEKEFADYGSDIFESVMTKIKISLQDISEPHLPQSANNYPARGQRSRAITTPASLNSSLSGHSYSLSELENQILDRECKPSEIIIENQTISVSDWTDLSKNFVEWLIREGTLNKSNLPIYSYSNREEKYFINITPKHKIPERDGQWQRVGEFFIDTKYNADGHKKNILHALTVLQISNIDIKISFR